MPKDITGAVREVCLSFPEAEEFISHGMATYRVKKGRSFAMYAVNHHGDGRIALWLNVPDGAQEHYTHAQPKHFFVPPYVGPSGWLGVHLDKGVSWTRVAALARQAFEKVAPKALAAKIGRTIRIEPPTAKVAAKLFDPMHSARSQQVLNKLAKICLSLPETSEGRQFGNPVWRAGKRVFAQAFAYDGRLRLAFWVGVARQGLLTADPRYEIPKYIGHNGWVALDVSRRCNWEEIRGLALESYRHFALKRMLAKLEPIKGRTPRR